jgi:hypothetical protein
MYSPLLALVVADICGEKSQRAKPVTRLPRVTAGPPTTRALVK